MHGCCIGTSTLQEVDVAVPTKRSFVIIGDNWDKTINPRFMTGQHQRQSLHYFHSYAALDRIDFSDLSIDEPQGEISELPPSAYLPDANDCAALCNNYAVILSRVLADEVSYFKNIFGDCVDRHIQHKYSSQMNEKSKMVSMHVIHGPACYDCVFFRFPWESFQKMKLKQMI